MECRPFFHPPAVRGGQALSLSLSKDLWRLWSQTEEQTGLHHTRMVDRRLCYNPSSLLHGREKVKLETSRVTPFPAFCGDGSSGDHLLAAVVHLQLEAAKLEAG